MTVRPTRSEDLPALETVLDETGLFPSEMLAGLFESSRSGSDEPGLWLTALDGETAIGFCYSAREALTDGTWNMRAIAVLTAKQGAGTGRALVAALEDVLRGDGQRVLIVDTSGTPDFGEVRAFYRGIGYEEEARIRDFWAAGDDKVVFRKAL